MPFEGHVQNCRSFISVDISLARAILMATPKINEGQKYSPPTLVGGTANSHGKRYNSIKGENEKLGAMIHSTHLFIANIV